MVLIWSWKIFFISLMSSSSCSTLSSPSPTRTIAVSHLLVRSPTATCSFTHSSTASSLASSVDLNLSVRLITSPSRSLDPPWRSRSQFSLASESLSRSSRPLPESSWRAGEGAACCAEVSASPFASLRIPSHLFSARLTSASLSPTTRRCSSSRRSICRESSLSLSAAALASFSASAALLTASSTLSCCCSSCLLVSATVSFSLETTSSVDIAMVSDASSFPSRTLTSRSLSSSLDLKSAVASAAVSSAFSAAALSDSISSSSGRLCSAWALAASSSLASSCLYLCSKSRFSRRMLSSLSPEVDSSSISDDRRR
mmetsp:Transcript_11927/g.36261  ORF Transcript_11927/g.36261 Transcript_11927/m.36261 type:complete len:314 (-) Transcript_11927:70-1011(-)